MIFDIATVAAIAPSRSVGGGVRSAMIADASGWPTSAAPVVDIMLVIDRTFSGCSIAIIWTIIPPIDAPTMCEAEMPRASSSPTASAAIVDRLYGASTGWPAIICA